MSCPWSMCPVVSAASHLILPHTTSEHLPFVTVVHFHYWWHLSWPCNKMWHLSEFLFLWYQSPEVDLKMTHSCFLFLFAPNLKDTVLVFKKIYLFISIEVLPTHNVTCVSGVQHSDSTILYTMLSTSVAMVCQVWRSSSIHAKTMWF